MTETTVTPNVAFGALIGKGVLLIILGVLIGVFTLASTFVAVTMLSILLIFLGVALLCGGTSFGKSGVASVVLGILVIILGIITLVNPGAFEVFLVYFIAIAAIIQGLFSLVTGIMGAGAGNRVMNIIIGILGIAVGVAIIVLSFTLTPVIVGIIMMYVIGIFLIVIGILSIIQAILIKSAQKKAMAA